METIEARLKQFLTMEELSPATFADKLGIQRSGISHLLAGRNKPSYDFITRMLDRFPDLSAEWLLMGKGKPYKEASAHPAKAVHQPENGSQDANFPGFAPEDDFPLEDPQPSFEQQLFGNEGIDVTNEPAQPLENPIFDTFSGNDTPISAPQKANPGRRITRITIFYSDGTYEEK